MQRYSSHENKDNTQQKIAPVLEDKLKILKPADTLT